MTHLMGGLVMAVVLALSAAPSPTPAPTYTPYPTYTSVPSASPTPSATPSPTPPPPPKSGPGGTAGSPCATGDFGFGFTLPVVGQETICVPLGSLLASIFEAAAGLFTGALSAIIAPFNAVLTVTPDPGAWPDARAVFDYMWGVGIALYGTLVALAALHYYRRMVWAGEHSAPLLMLSDAVQGAILVAAAPWLMTTWLSLVNDLAQSVNAFIGPLGLNALTHLVGDLAALASDPLLVVVDTIVALLELVFMLLVGLIRLVALYAFVWLYALAPLFLGCWVYPPLRPLAVSWFRAFASVSLYGVGFAVALKVIAVMTLDLRTTDAAYGNPIIVALTGLAGTFFLFGVPRLVDMLIGTGVAAASGSYTLAAGVVAGVAGQATRAIKGPK